MNDLFVWIIRTAIAGLAYTSSKLLIKSDADPHGSPWATVKSSLWVVLFMPMVSVFVFSAVFCAGSMADSAGLVELGAAFIGSSAALIKTLIDNANDKKTDMN
jgi:hypothetical protein